MKNVNNEKQTVLVKRSREIIESWFELRKEFKKELITPEILILSSVSIIIGLGVLLFSFPSGYLLGTIGLFSMSIFVLVVSDIIRGPRYTLASKYLYLVGLISLLAWMARALTGNDFFYWFTAILMSIFVIYVGISRRRRQKDLKRRLKEYQAKVIQDYIETFKGSADDQTE